MAATEKSALTETTGVVTLAPVTPAHCRLAATAPSEVVFCRAATMPEAATVSLPKPCTVTGMDTSNRRRRALLPSTTCAWATASVAASEAVSCDAARLESVDTPPPARESVVLTSRSVMFTVTAAADGAPYAVASARARPAAEICVGSTPIRKTLSCGAGGNGGGCGGGLGGGGGGGGATSGTEIWILTAKPTMMERPMRRPTRSVATRVHANISPAWRSFRDVAPQRGTSAESLPRCRGRS